MKKIILSILSCCMLHSAQAMNLHHPLLKSLSINTAKPTQAELDQELFDACFPGDVKAAKKLIKKGANVNARDWEQKTPLMHAITNEAVCLLFIEAKADVNAQDIAGRTALTMTGNPFICSRLIRAGANVNHQTKAGFTPLICAASGRGIVFGGHTKIDLLATCKVLIKAGAKLDLQTNNLGWTALMCTAIHMRVENFALLLAHGADIYIRDQEGNPVLIILLPERNLRLPNELNETMHMIQLILDTTLQLTHDEQQSIKYWLLVNCRLQQKGGGVGKDLRKYIAQWIHRLLAQDIYERSVRAGAREALELAQQGDAPEIAAPIEIHLDPHQLERIVRQRSWPFTQIDSAPDAHPRRNQLQRNVGFRLARGKRIPEYGSIDLNQN